MSTAAMTIRRARRQAGLTQTQLAARMGVTQSVVARLERADANPRVDTLERALAAAGRRLELRAARRRLPEIDETQIRGRLLLTPAERLAAFQASQRNLRRLTAQTRRLDELAP